MTPQEAYETIEDAYQERMAIVRADGYTNTQAELEATRDRAKRELAYLRSASSQDWTDYLEIVGKSRGRLEARMLRIIVQNALQPLGESA
jgi:hypothetical protein